MLAMLGGLRQSEILTLKARDIRDDGIIVANSWDRKTKALVLPKNGKTRSVPLAAPLLMILKAIVEQNEYSEEGYLFPNSLGTGPLDHKVVNDRFYDALASIGVDSEKRLARHITFHSWRHYANTRLRSIVGDLLTREVIGHSDIEMQDHYTHAKEEDRKKVIQAQLEILGRVA